VTFTQHDNSNLAEAQDLIDRAYEHFADNSMGRYLLTDGIITITVGGYLNRKMDLTPMHIKVQSSVFAGAEQGFTGTQELLDWAMKTYRDEMARIA
jgi:hypothetical protein